MDVRAQLNEIVGASLIALLAIVAPARSDPPTFMSSTPQGTSCPVWEIVGDIVVPTTTDTHLFLTTDEQGRISGLSSENYSYEKCTPYTTGPGCYEQGTVTVSLDGPVTGKIKGKNSVNKVDLRISMTGTAYFSGRIGVFYNVGYSSPVTSAFKIKGEIDTAGTLQGTMFRPETVERTFPIAMDVTPDPANDGSWTLNLNVTSPNAKKLQGTGEIVLATGHIIDLTAGGKYKPKADKSNLKLVSEQGSKIALKALTADASTTTLVDGQLKGKVMGQKRKSSFPCP